MIGLTLPTDYAERVYAGVLGKIVGVYLGRPFEGWSHACVQAELGEIDYYVNGRPELESHKRRNPLVQTDDDIAGTFTFLRTLLDYGNTRDLSPRQIGQTWLTYVIEKRGMLWRGRRTAGRVGVPGAAFPCQTGPKTARGSRSGGHGVGPESAGSRSWTAPSRTSADAASATFARQAPPSW